MRSVIAVILTVLLMSGARAQDACEGPPADQPLALSRPVGGSIVREFGDTWVDALAKKVFNPGIDFEAQAGEPVYAAAGGRAVQSGPSAAAINTVRIDHGGGLQTLYAGLGSVSVSEGACVKPGEQIGVAGGAGSEAASQVHFELRRDGKPEDPTQLLP